MKNTSVHAWCANDQLQHHRWQSVAGLLAERCWGTWLWGHCFLSRSCGERIDANSATSLQQQKIWKSTDDLGFTVELALSKVTGAKKGRAVDSCWLFLADVKAVLESFHVNVQPEVWENIVRSINHQHPGLSITLEHEPTNTHSNWIASAEQPFVAQFPCKASS